MKAQFITKLRFEDEGGLPFTLLEPLVYISNVVTATPGKVGKITVPAGTKTDLASIPRFFWRVLPPIGKYDLAAVLHDYLYQRNGVSRQVADSVLLEAMEVCSVNRFQRWVIYSGVRVGGWKPWNRYRAKE